MSTGKDMVVQKMEIETRVYFNQSPILMKAALLKEGRTKNYF